MDLIIAITRDIIVVVVAYFIIKAISNKLSGGNRLKVKVKKLNDSARIPTKGTKGANAYDFYSAEDTTLEPYETKVIKLGLAMELPNNYMLILAPRSSIGLKTPLRMANSYGVIDSDYRGEIGAIYTNTSNKTYKVKKGDRIAQGYIQKTPKLKFKKVEKLSNTERGARGYGSTGK